jgi:hypothetical protein
MGDPFGDPNLNWVVKRENMPPTTDPNRLPILGFVEAVT